MIHKHGQLFIMQDGSSQAIGTIESIEFDFEPFAETNVNMKTLRGLFSSNSKSKKRYVNIERAKKMMLSGGRQWD